MLIITKLMSKSSRSISMHNWLSWNREHRAQYSNKLSRLHMYCWVWMFQQILALIGRDFPFLKNFENYFTIGLKIGGQANGHGWHNRSIQKALTSVCAPSRSMSRFVKILSNSPKINTSTCLKRQMLLATDFSNAIRHCSSSTINTLLQKNVIRTLINSYF